jgi:AcrR family transcriptional regulator
MPRKYQLMKRAERQAETRDRIVRAAIELHAAGPATMGAIAARARVGRATLYRHFPDEQSLIVACTSTVFAERPLPDPGHWEAIPDATDRLRAGLGEMYGYYADMEPLLSSAEAHLADFPALAAAMAPMGVQLDRMTDVLVAPWLDGARSRTLGAAVSHALAFSTWRSLAREQRLTGAEAVEMMVSMVTAVARDMALRLPREEAVGTRQAPRRAH